MKEAPAILECQNQQAAREAQWEEDIAAARMRKEREASEMRKKQQKAIDPQADDDDLPARRVQERSSAGRRGWLHSGTAWKTSRS